jgi:mono/diheme cytochrome c family protein
MVALVTLVVVETTALVYLGLRTRWMHSAADTTVGRGRQLAESMGCFACHGPGGGQPIANPGARGGEVPGWTGGTWRMWNRSAEDLRAWITDGRPPGREPDPGALLHMPAYGARLSPGQIDDLVAYVAAVSQFGPDPDEQVAAGKDAAWRLGCFGCHGPEGRGLLANPGSFTGYVPPWDGHDYAELVRDEAEFRQWVRRGVCDRLARNPVAREFLSRQAISMPAYGDHVSDRELRALYAYVGWVRATPRGRPR